MSLLARGEVVANQPHHGLIGAQVGREVAITRAIGDRRCSDRSARTARASVPPVARKSRRTSAWWPAPSSRRGNGSGSAARPRVSSFGRAVEFTGEVAHHRLAHTGQPDGGRDPTNAAPAPRPRTAGAWPNRNAICPRPRADPPEPTGPGTRAGCPRYLSASSKKRSRKSSARRVSTTPRPMLADHSTSSSDLSLPEMLDARSLHEASTRAGAARTTRQATDEEARRGPRAPAAVRRSSSTPFKTSRPCAICPPRRSCSAARWRRRAGLPRIAERGGALVGVGGQHWRARRSPDTRPRCATSRPRGLVGLRARCRGFVQLGGAVEGQLGARLGSAASQA